MLVRKSLVWLCLWSLLVTAWAPFSIASAETVPDGLTDDMVNFTSVFQRSNMRIETADKQYFGNDGARMTRNTVSAGYLVYKTGYDIQTFTAYSYSYTGADVPFVPQRFYVSADGSAYTEVLPERYTSGAPVANWQPFIYEGSGLPAGTRYLKIEFAGDLKAWTPQLAKLVLNRNVASVLADPPSGVIGDTPLAVQLVSPTVGAAVYYKTQADPAFKPYTGPLSLSGFTVLETYAGKDGWEASPIRSYTYFSRADMLVDRYGQVMKAEFPSKVTSDQELADDVARDTAYYGSLDRPAAFDELGGLKNSKETLQLAAKGFFTIQRSGGKPVMVTPQGNLYFSLGVNGITANETFTTVKSREHVYEWLPPYDSEYRSAFQGSKDVFSFYMANKQRKSGSIPSNGQFFAEAVERIKKWGFNSAGAWGSGLMASQNGLPYTLVLPLNGMGKPAEIKVFDIFAADAETKIDEAFAKMLPYYKDDPLLIGYFVDNEYHYEKFLQTVPKLKASKTGLKQRLVRMLQEKYGDIALFNEAWGTTFSGFADLNESALYIDTAEASADIEQFFRLYLDTYYSTVKRLFQKYDPNHLLLGDRWLTLPMQSPKIRGILAEEAGKYMDVISINHYARDLDPTMLNEVYTKSGGKPILLSEWSYGTAEQGLNPIVPGAAATEQERQWRYRNYVEGAAALGYVVGTHWFDYVDQAATGRWFEGLTGERYNTGLINVADRPYKLFLDGVMSTHRDIYEVMLGKKAPFRHDFGDGAPGGGTGKDQVIDIPYTPVPVPIDGEVNGLPEGAAGKAVLTAANRTSGSGGEDITAEYAFAWDEQHLYVTAKVNEPTPMRNTYQNSNIWKGDGVELFVGPSELSVGGDLQFDDRQIILSAGLVNGTPYWLWFNTGRQTPVEMAVKPLPDGTGYVLEAALPWTALHIEPSDGREFLFDFGFDDSEDGMNRKRQWVWNGTSRNNLDRGLWGSAKLTEAAADTAPPTITVTGVEDGGDYTDRAIPVIEVTDAGSGVRETAVKLDGADYASGTPVTGPGVHKLEVTAKDHAGHSSTAAVSFAVYGSTVVSVEPAAGVYSDPVRLAAAVAGPGGAPVTSGRVAFFVGGSAAGEAEVGPGGTAGLDFDVGLGAGNYDVRAVYLPGGNMYYRASEGLSALPVNRKEAVVRFTGSGLVTGGAAVPLEVRVSEKEPVLNGSAGVLGGLTVQFAVYAVQPDGSRVSVPLPAGAEAAVTDADGVAVRVVPLPAGLYEARAILAANPYYDADAGAAASVAVQGAAGTARLKMKGYAELPPGSLPDPAWAGKLHIDADLGGSHPGKWRIFVPSGGLDLGVETDWAVVTADRKLFLQGRTVIGGETATVRLLTEDAEGRSGRVSFEVWRGKTPSGWQPDVSAYGLEFTGIVQVKE